MSFPLFLAMDSGDLIPIAGVTGGIAIALVAIIASSVRSGTREREREQTRREIAAYVAEGSMTPEDGVKLIAAGTKAGGSCGKA